MSLNSQIKTLFNDIKHYVAAKQKNLYWTREQKKYIFDNYVLREHILLNFQ